MNPIAKHDRLLQVLQQRIFMPLDAEIPLKFRSAENGDRATALTELRDHWQPVDRDLVWGEPDGYYWFAGTATIPQAGAGRRVFCRVEAQFGSVMGRSDPQCLVRIDGRIAQGVDGNHREFLLSENAVPGQRFDIVIEAGTIEDRRQLGFSCRLLAHDPLAEKLYFDLKVPLDVARLLKSDDAAAAASSTTSIWR
jgi:alpha-mannosidase